LDLIISILLLSDLKYWGVEAPSADASTPISSSLCGSSGIRSAAGDIEGDVRSTSPWENTQAGTYCGGIAPRGEARVVASIGRGNNAAIVCRNGDDILAQRPEE
jgi:hypothetical protein